MLSARIKAIFVLLFATIVIMAVTVKNTPPVSEYMQTGIRLLPRALHQGRPQQLVPRRRR